MRDRLTVPLLIAALILPGAGLCGADYHVAPGGDDAHDGLSPATAWRSVGKVNATAFLPGDRILFARSGAWHEALTASTSGGDGKPIIYDAYGSGDKPVFWGSDPLAAGAWQELAPGRYRCRLSAPTVTQVLADHGTGAHGQWYGSGTGVGTFSYEAGELTLESASDPRRDGRSYSAVSRQDVVSSHGKDHLVFRNLHGEETADPANGYVFRVMGSVDVILEDCEAYRGGRHNFGVINSTGFIGRRLQAAWAIPKQATLYVSYSGSESAYSGCTAQWIDCAGDHFEDGSIFFVCHGQKLGQLTFVNPHDHGGKISILEDSPDQHVRIDGGLIEDGSLELICSHAVIDGTTFAGSSAVDCYGHDNLLQNLKMAIKPERGGPTGYGAAILMRKGARANTVRFCSVLMDPAAGTDKSCLLMLEPGLNTSWYGNILVGGSAVGGADLGAADARQCDCNLYGPGATIGSLALAAWQAKGFADPHSLASDPRFTAPGQGDLTLRADSPARTAAAAVAPLLKDLPLAHDAAGRARPRTGAYSIGAFEPAGR